ncbi:MAG: type II toxin-antitoxin system RelE/ParE family toxin [Armatimonadetes bacterium]|nr:type II toxin-antitoxin system RelE/ParE family toxin [Armatimonadota bacterium]NCO92219.1 type II toxin-antitoxin system RelE/ParE family toxin [Armatimonadota bacterium]NCP32646.1 type II toxin-antitoxin system RelE/ParE family toxin [Armatimonadota bacterium]NCQ31026.1 type II toxin-antitoxin system RelE/ParE family toxin [Armatimonadota bacterium]NDK13819.1 type II toxin-antitoxin system RelE/ParE family toxin [Armatimonadota bacterium]
MARKFLAAAEACERTLRCHPALGSPSGHETRTCRVKGFPFGLVYTEYADHLLVVAVVHFSREPRY